MTDYLTERLAAIGEDEEEADDYGLFFYRCSECADVHPAYEALDALDSKEDAR